MSSTRSRFAAALLPLTLVFTACGQKADTPTAPPPSTAASATESAELAGVEVAGAAGAKPKVTFPKTPFTVSAPGHRVVQKGTGATITDQDTVTGHLLLLNGKDGKEIESRFGKEVVGLQMTDETLQPAIRSALVGQKVGSRILVAMPAKEAVGEQGNAQLGIAAQDTLVYYFEITATKTPLKQAAGTPVAPKAGLPTVKMGAKPTDPATITIPKGAKPPTKTVVQPLIQGKGAEVKKGQTVRVTYTGTTWRDPSKPFDYSGKSPQGYAEFPVGQGGLIKAWDNGLVGQKVGSRLLIVAPPADGYGAQGQPKAGIKGTDTLVFVLDILDAN